MAAERRLRSELKNMTDSPIENVYARPIDDNIYKWRATIIGAKNSPYQGGNFFLDIEFPTNYPFKPPKVVFITKIYHCNVNTSGGICLDILKDQWSPALTISKVLLSICSLMDDPNPDDPLMIDIAELYRTNRAQHDENATIYTIKYAMEITG